MDLTLATLLTKWAVSNIYVEVHKIEKNRFPVVYKARQLSNLQMIDAVRLRLKRHKLLNFDLRDVMMSLSYPRPYGNSN